MKVKTLLSNENKWVQERFYWNGRYCLYGALQVCYGGTAGEKGPRTPEFREAKQRVQTAISVHTRKKALHPNIVLFNDNANTTFKDIRAVIRLANV